MSKGKAQDLSFFQNIIQVNLIETFNMLRLAAERMIQNEQNEEGEWELIINTASVAAYSASKGRIVSKFFPIAREFTKPGIRVMNIAPGLIETPLLQTLSEEARASLGAMVPFPSRLGRPEEFANLIQSIIKNPMLNGETIRLDGAIRMQPE